LVRAARVTKEFPKFPKTETYDELREAILAASHRLESAGAT